MIKVEIKDLKRKIRFDKWLTNYSPDASRGDAKNLIIFGLVQLNGEMARPKDELTNGDVVNINIDEIRKFILIAKADNLYPTKMELKIVYEDANTLVLDKPSGIVVHPDREHIDDSLLNGVIYYIITTNSNPFAVPHVVNRLDKDTSGLVVFSKSFDTHNFYSRQFKKREVEKIYLAVVNGDFKSLLDKQNVDHFTKTSFIRKYPTDRKYMSIDSDQGDFAETEFRFEKYIGDKNQYSLLQVKPKTGRTHQIRVHLSEMGFPIVGDKIYNGEKADRMMLHAWKLRIKIYSNMQDEIKEQNFETSMPNKFF